ncbi:histidine kinase [Polaribacter sp. MSW13]|uniref:Histidine kinase n=1 Tax=Polaribacter marinus TaxID=2916838 RepID=A0A9X2AIQ3_9FLAO|nr:histidine kinase [Polaribacter marinus]MCI2228312.1 histidine kinase [Polaribacter marinus]
MKFLKIHITLVFILIWSFSYSQQYTKITVKEGLPSNHVYKIIQDTNGFIWFATDKGLVKYNGNSMKTFTTRNGLSSNDVWGLHATTDGKVWYLSKTSKLGYIKNDSVYAFESEIKDEIFAPNYTSQIGNKIILTSNSRSHHLINGKWKLLLSNNLLKNKPKIYIKHPNIAFLDSSTNLDTVKIIYQNGKTKVLTGLGNIKNPINRGQITDSIFYWVGEKKYTILNLNTSKIYSRNYKDEIGLEKSKYTRINLINNQIQITGKGFVGILDANFHITKSVLIPSKLDAHFAMIDKNETLWIATFLNGAYQLSKTKTNIKYSFEHENVSKTNAIKGEIIANIYNHGFFKYNADQKKFSPYIKENEYLFSATYIDSLETEFYISKNKIKVKKSSTKTKVFDFTKFPFYTNETARKLVYYNNYLYGDFTGGINKIDSKNLEIIKYYNQRGINNLITFNNQFLIATTNGLKQFKNQEIKEVTFKGIRFTKSILSINKISETHLLLNTDGFGSFVTDLNDIYQLPNSDYLIVNNAFIENKNIWLATNSGVYKYFLHKNHYRLEKKLLLANGLPSLQVNDVFVLKDDVIVSTNNGIAILPKNQKKSNDLLDIYIDKLSYNNHLIKPNNSTFKYIANNNINISVSSIDFSEGNQNLSYQYKLEPLQTNWKTTETTNINFNDLQANKYIFNIKTHNFQKKIEFTILPLWYQTLWFKATVLLILISLFFRTVWYLSKRKQVQKSKKILQEKQLSEIQLKALRSQMNPHFVFNSLAAIQYFINENNFEDSEKYLVKFSKLIRRFFELSKETTITLKEEIELLTNYLEIEKLRFKEKLEFKINIEDKVGFEKTKIPTMLLQPIVENAVNHGIFNKFDTGKVTINFIKIDDKTYQVLIIDDGVGFVNTQSKNKKIKSSRVLQQRLSYLNTSKEWEIEYFTEELYPEKDERGNKSTFIIKNK